MVIALVPRSTVAAPPLTVAERQSNFLPHTVRAQLRRGKPKACLRELSAILTIFVLQLVQQPTFQRPPWPAPSLRLRIIPATLVDRAWRLRHLAYKCSRQLEWTLLPWVPFSCRSYRIAATCGSDSAADAIGRWDAPWVIPTGYEVLTRRPPAGSGSEPAGCG